MPNELTESSGTSVTATVTVARFASWNAYITP
jgi:hypothetical protein